MCSVIGWSDDDDADWLLSSARFSSNWNRCRSSSSRCSSILFRSARIWFCRVMVSSSVFQFWTDSDLKDSRFWDILVRRFSTLGDDRPESCVGFEAICVGGDWGSSVIVAPKNFALRIMSEDWGRILKELFGTSYAEKIVQWRRSLSKLHQCVGG